MAQSNETAEFVRSLAESVHTYRNEMEGEIDQTVADRVSAPEAGVDHEGKCSKRAEFLERLAPDAS